jgi:hypothetical protein
MLALFPSFSLVAYCLYAKTPGVSLVAHCHDFLFPLVEYWPWVAGQENVWRRLKPHHVIAGNYLSNKQIFLKPYLTYGKLHFLSLGLHDQRSVTEYFLQRWALPIEFRYSDILIAI